MEKLGNVHPGEVLEEEFLKPFGISQYRLAKDLGVDQRRISLIVAGRRSITTETALMLGAYFGTSAQLWIGLQNDYDLEEERLALADRLAEIEGRGVSARPSSSDALAEALQHEDELAADVRDQLVTSTH